LVRNQVHARFGIFLFLIVLSTQAIAQADDSFKIGEDFFLNKQTEKSIPFLEAAIRENPEREMAYYHLGDAYLVVGRFTDAIAILKKGAQKFPDKSYELFRNIGLCYFMQNKSAFAKEWYDQAIAQNGEYALAYLDRANVFMNLKDYPSAISDFREYLSLAPTSPQRENIEKIIGLIQSGLDEAERKKAEEAARLAAEEAKRQQMLADVAASLKESAADTQSLSAGSENAEGYTDESELAE
jgi:tetratricopeptide (TPR) repeat protein